MSIELVYEDDWLVAVNKEPGLLVHRSWLDRHETRFAMQLTRDAVGCHVFPVHRLDRPTSGLLLFGKSAEVARSLTDAFGERRVNKTYLALVRGYLEGEGRLDYALTRELDDIADKFADADKPPQEAITRWQELARVELPFAVSKKHATSRYSLVRLSPETGRKHQLRRHMAHLRHPIVGDTSHGDGRHNRFFREQYQCDRLMLHAARLQLTHPVTGMPLRLDAPLDTTWRSLICEFGWERALAASRESEVESALSAG
ncbi:tRNA pseudouridine(65) synthase TruC [Oceanimonas doudoroffii]|uniref:tRNA pseudouridine synthase C n=1 Tax=Oceanimonas doudoroffii TaxID=84158 RepID=A0A233RI79_9GAMM|nr:tRNA pseudouridine(65) synthase TruC [Oceanimonas doudoroffii]OXY83100.1 tRNA pseudouridine(65) synthase TruC [Oceanimonas doudoroffii]